MKRLEDEKINQELCSFVSLDNLKSFFLLAGAGAGKTRSLVTALQHLQKSYGTELRETGKEIAVITYTKAASAEIKSRLNDDSVFHISTIHNFAWKTIQNFQWDIKKYMKRNAERKLEEIKLEISQKGSTKTRELKKERYREKVSQVEGVKRYNYSPDITVNSGISTLTHNDVENILEEFIKNKECFQRIIIQKYPVLLIDECQDTKKGLLEAFLKLEEKESRFCLGLFGDMMQRVYSSGMSELELAVNEWENKPKKLMNWRSQERIVKLLNNIRDNSDGLVQYWNKEKSGGTVRLYILPDNLSDKEWFAKEECVKKDFLNQAGVKGAQISTLVLEHRMAARRNDFLGVHEALSKKPTKDQVDDASGKELTFIKQIIIPLFNSINGKNEFEILSILRKEKQFNVGLSEKSFEKLISAIKDVQQKSKDNKKYLRDIIEMIDKIQIFEIPNVFKIKDEEDPKSVNWQNAMDCTLEEFERYFTYKNKRSDFITQQGSKGLEYEHVMVIMNDYEKVGNLFNFERFFGLAELTTNDKGNILEGRDNVISRTRRLFYVAASRAKESLALVLYTSDIPAAKRHFIEQGLMEEYEIITELN